MKTTIALLGVAVLLSVAGCDASGPEESCATRLNGVEVENGHFAVTVESGDDCHLIEGLATYEPGDDRSVNRTGEPVFLVRLFSTETELVLWFAREQRGAPAPDDYDIADLPDEPTGTFETRFVTNPESVSAMGIHVSRNRAFSEGGTFAVLPSEDGIIEVRFNMTVDLAPSGEGGAVAGYFKATETDMGYPIIF